jgi:hypothetical protein
MLFFLFLIQNVFSHGFLFNPNVHFNDYGVVRNIEKIDIEIDLLRNPTSIDCTTLSESEKVLLQLENGKPHTVLMAISIGAQHVGKCLVEIIDADTNEIVILSNDQQDCAKRVVFSSTSDVDCIIPKGLVTNDMCLQEWTFIPINVELVKCNNCILKWTWTATHITPFEHFETCVDVDFIKSNSRHSGVGSSRSGVGSSRSSVASSSSGVASSSSGVGSSRSSVASSGSFASSGGGVDKCSGTGLHQCVQRCLNRF